jgi:hypothetical protein
MDALDPPKPYRYIAYIDEAGDFGLRNIAPIDPRGASEWLVLAAVVIRADSEPSLISEFRRLRIAIKNIQSVAMHFRSLSDRQKKSVCSWVASVNSRLSVVISNKQNMRRHRNRRAAHVSHTSAWFYWWMRRLLLERVTEFCERRNDRDDTPRAKVRVELSRHTDLKYRELTSYLAKLQLQEAPVVAKRVPRWSVVDLQQFHPFDHDTRAGLQLADVVASAFYRSINRIDRAVPKPEYAEALREKVWSKSGEWFDNGFSVFPVPLSYPKLDEDQKRIFRFYGFPEDKW